MRSMPIVLVEPDGQLSGALVGGVVSAGIGPFAQACLDEALSFAIGSRGIGPGAQMLDPEQTQRFAVAAGAEARTVVGHDAVNPDAEVAKESQGVEEKAQAGRAFLVGQDFRVGEARMVVDRQMQRLPAHPPSVALTGAVADAIELAELLDVDVDDLAWGVALITANRLGRLERGQAVEAEALEDTADGGGRHADFGGDLLAGVAAPAQSLDRRGCGRRRLVRR